MVSIEDFSKLEIKIGKIIGVEKHPNADKLLKLKIDLGDEQRQVLAGVAEFYSEEEIIGKQTPILVNLEPKELRGEESQGMILAADDKGKPVLLTPEEEVPLGSKVR